MPWTSAPLPIPADENGTLFSRVDLRFLEIDHSGDSFEGRIFLNNEDVDVASPTDLEAGYAGSLFVFGHRHCWGDEGHCVVPPGPLHGFDHREPHHLVPQIHEVEVTEAVRRLVQNHVSSVTVTVLPVVRRDGQRQVDDDQLRFSELQLVSYD